MEWRTSRQELMQRCLEAAEPSFSAVTRQKVACCCSEASEIALRVSDQLSASEEQPEDAGGMSLGDSCLQTFQALDQSLTAIRTISAERLTTAIMRITCQMVKCKINPYANVQIWRSESAARKRAL